jgi:hypothetical protein
MFVLSVRYFCSTLTQSGMLLQILLNTPNIKLHGNSFSDSRIISYVPTDETYVLRGVLRKLETV